MTETPARIGPNAILHLIPVIEDAAGQEMTRYLLANSGIVTLPDPEAGMIAEAPAARLHQALRAALPERAARLATKAGHRTGDYILERRIPRAAQLALRGLPSRIATPILARAVERHAWTFCGSGTFRRLSGWPPVFEIIDNPVVRGERAATPLCHWHAAVFERLFSALCGRDWVCRETQCCAQGASSCRFELSRNRS